MIVEHEAIEVVSNFDGEEFEGSIDSSKLGTIISLLIKNYNDPVAATLREWVSNAWDSHKEAGQTKPIKVVAPSRLDPTMSVEDFGIGMSYDDVRNMYVRFLRSTKNESNDAIGGFGIGGKSALAIADQYTMVTIKDGLKNVFIFERSASSGLNVKSIVRDSNTDAPNGVKVSVSVANTESINSVSLLSVLNGWNSQEVEVLNAEWEAPLDDAIELESGYLGEKLFSANEDSSRYGYGYGYGYAAFNVSVGKVIYGLSRDILNKLSQENIRLIHRYGKHFTIKLPVGSVTFPSSREVIEPTQSNFETIEAAIAKFLDEVGVYVSERVAKVKSLKEAFEVANSGFVAGSGVEVTYQGEVISTVEYKITHLFDMEHTDAGYRMAKVTSYGETIMAKMPAYIVLLDEEEAKLSLETLRTNTRAAIISDLQSGALKHTFTRDYVLFTDQHHKLMDITAAKVVKYSEIKATREKNATPRASNANAMKRAIAEVSNWRVFTSSSRKADLLYVKDSEAIKKHGAVIFSYSNNLSARDLEALTHFFPELKGRIITPRLKSQGKLMKRAYPNSVTYDEFLCVIEKKRIKEIRKRVHDAAKLATEYNLNGFSQENFETMLSDNPTLDPRIKEIFSEDILAISAVGYTATTLIRLVGAKDFARKDIEARPLSLISFNYTRHLNPEAITYINWSVERILGS